MAFRAASALGGPPPQLREIRVRFRRARQYLGAHEELKQGGLTALHSTLRFHSFRLLRFLERLSLSRFLRVNDSLQVNVHISEGRPRVRSLVGYQRSDEENVRGIREVQPGHLGVGRIKRERHDGHV